MQLIFLDHIPESRADTSELEMEADMMVYELYELTPEEIEIVAGRRIN